MYEKGLIPAAAETRFWAEPSISLGACFYQAAWHLFPHSYKHATPTWFSSRFRLARRDRRVLTAGCPPGRTAPSRAAPDLRRGRVSAAYTALPRLRGGTSRGWHHVCAQPQRNPPSLALISCGKHFPGAGWRGQGRGSPLAAARSRPPPASPAARQPRGRLSRGSASRATRNPRGAPRARLRAPSPAAPGAALSAATKPPSAPLPSAHLTPALRSAATVPRQPGWWRRGKDPGAASRLPPPATPRRCRQRSGSGRAPAAPPSAHALPAGSGRQEREEEEEREREREGWSRGRCGSARPCCVTMRGALPRDPRGRARRLRGTRAGGGGPGLWPPRCPRSCGPATAALPQPPRGSCALRESLPTVSENAAPACPMRNAWHAATLKIMEMQSSMPEMASSIHSHLFKIKFREFGSRFFFF